MAKIKLPKIPKLGVFEFIGEKIGGPVKDTVIAKVIDQATDGVPLVGPVLDLVLGADKTIPKEAFSIDDISKIKDLSAVDQENIDAMIRIAELEAEREANLLKAQNEETQSARDQELAIMNSPNAGWLDKNIMEILALAAWFGAIILIIIVIYKGSDISELAFQLLTNSFSQFLTIVTIVYGYYFSKKVGLVK